MRKLTHGSETAESGRGSETFMRWVVGFVLGGQRASVRETGQGFPSARCARPLTELSPGAPNCSARKRRHNFEVSRGQVHFFAHSS